MAENSWDLGKEHHKTLSAIAAKSYDRKYENSNFATGSYMQYEIDLIKKFATDVPNNDIALDIGCGTGRDSFVISRYFSQVYGYDFVQEMITVADKTKVRKTYGNVEFSVRDVEDGSLPWKANAVSFINTAFGMGSFVINLDKLLKEFRKILIPEGIAIISCYNSNALVNHLNLKWKPALAARVSTDADVLDVDYDDTVYKISAKAYNIKEIKRKIEQTFGQNSILSLTTFPTLAALFPQELFESEKTRELCTQVDKLLASNESIAGGPYIVAVIRKSGRFVEDTSRGYEKVVELLRIHDIDLENIKSHRPAETIADIVSIFKNDFKKQIDMDSLVKSILITNNTNIDERANKETKLWLLGIPANKQLDFGKLPDVLNEKRSALSQATFSQVVDLTGFSIGSIPPFGHPRSIPVILDSSFKNKNEVWCGTGKTTESIVLTMQQLTALCTPSFADVSK